MTRTERVRALLAETMPCYHEVSPGPWAEGVSVWRTCEHAECQALVDRAFGVVMGSDGYTCADWESYSERGRLGDWTDRRSSRRTDGIVVDTAGNEEKGP